MIDSQIYAYSPKKITFNNSYNVCVNTSSLSFNHAALSDLPFSSYQFIKVNHSLFFNPYEKQTIKARGR